MSEKRFKQLGDTHILDTMTGEEYYAPSEIELLDLLNSLYDENEQLRQTLQQTEKRINYWQNQYKEILDKIPPKIKEVWIE